MPRINRAAQFAPFDALKGLQDALRIVEYEHDKITKGELSEESAKQISDVMLKLEKNSIVKLKYIFDGYEKEYVGKIKLNTQNQTILIEKQTLPFDNIRSLELIT